jgi:hypothetical protein
MIESVSEQVFDDENGAYPVQQKCGESFIEHTKGLGPDPVAGLKMRMYPPREKTLTSPEKMNPEQGKCTDDNREGVEQISIQITGSHVIHAFSTSFSSLS